MKTEFDTEGLTQKRISLWIQDTSGWEAKIDGHPTTVVPIILYENTHRTQVNEAFTEYCWENRIGFGISEYLHQLD